MSLDGGDRSPLIETDEVPGDDAMSIMSEKIIGADESKLELRTLQETNAMKPNL